MHPNDLTLQTLQPSDATHPCGENLWPQSQLSSIQRLHYGAVATDSTQGTNVHSSSTRLPGRFCKDFSSPKGRMKISLAAARRCHCQLLSACYCEVRQRYRQQVHTEGSQAILLDGGEAQGFQLIGDGR